MRNINFKDSKVLTSSLDIKTNVGKTLSEIFLQLQSGAQMIATVVKKNISGETILNTVHGKMITNDQFNLSRGDLVNIKLVSIGNNITGEVVSINNQIVEGDNSINLKLFSQMVPLQDIKSDQVDLFPVDKQNLSIVPQEIKGIISYLNLSKMDKTTNLYKILEEMEIPSSRNIPISVKVVVNSMWNNKDNFIGIVSNNDKSGSQLIKTEFGIIASENTEMKLGQKLVLSITNLNNKPTTDILTQKITDLIEKIVDNKPTFDEIMKTVNFLYQLKHRRLAQNNYDLKYNIENDNQTSQTEYLNEIKISKDSQTLHFNNVIKLLENYEIKKIIHEYLEIKKLLQEDGDQIFDTKWQTIFLPIYIENKPEKHQFKIKRNGSNNLQFIIDFNFSNNPMQIDGNIEFVYNIKKPKALNLVLKSEKELALDLKNQIINIFNKNQEIFGINGSIAFQ